MLARRPPTTLALIAFGLVLGSCAIGGGRRLCDTDGECLVTEMCADGECVERGEYDAGPVVRVDGGTTTPCVPPMANCDGNPLTCEANLTSPATCGSCTNPCMAPTGATATCESGTCGFTCMPGLVPCGSECTASCGAMELRAPGPTGYTVPDGCTFLSVRAWGAGGGNGVGNLRAAAGGYAAAVIPVTGGESLTIEVGAPGADGMGGSFGAGGSPGGGRGGNGSDSQGGGGGGGYSGVFRGTPSQATALVVAGGGGGSGGDRSGQAGAGGGETGQAALSGGATGGTQTAGGAAGSGRGAPTPGTALSGGDAGDQGSGDGGGGGGGGYWGGGGGAGANSDAHPGGGGSGFAGADATAVTHETGSGPSPGNMAEADRMTAGDPRSAGAVLVECASGPG